jgi:hypothetical protein
MVNIEAVVVFDRTLISLLVIARTISGSEMPSIRRKNSSPFTEKGVSTSNGCEIQILSLKVVTSFPEKIK